MTTGTEPETTDSAYSDPTADSRDVLARLRAWEANAEKAGRETIEARVDAWQARIDALRIQVHLARMDARDEAALSLARSRQDSTKPVTGCVSWPRRAARYGRCSSKPTNARARSSWPATARVSADSR